MALQMLVAVQKDISGAPPCIAACILTACITAIALLCMAL